MSGDLPNRRLIRCSGLLLLAAAALPAQSQLPPLGAQASVALVAQIPESARVAWSVQPAPALPLENGSRASLLVLESTWHLAMGRSVTAAARLDTASEESSTAALILLRQAGEPPDARDIPALGFLARALPTRVSLLHTLDPRLGRQTQLNGLLVLHPAAPASQPQVVFVSVTAL